MKALILIGGLAALLASDAPGQEARLFAVTFYDRQFVTIDTNTGAPTVITNIPVAPFDLAVRDHALWLFTMGSSSERLIRLDPWTGAILEQESFHSTVTGGEGALDFAPDGTALAAKSTDTVGTFFRIDPTRTNVVTITAPGGLTPSLDGLAFDADGLLYGLSQNTGGNFTLFTVDTNTGATKVVGPLGINFPFAGGAVAGLAFAQDGTLFAGLGNPTESRLYRINKSTGAATLIGSIGLPGVSGLRFLVPPPGPLTIYSERENLWLNWPHARGGVLQSTTTITGQWQAMDVPISTNGPAAEVLVPATGNSRYFRLVLPE